MNRILALGLFLSVVGISAAELTVMSAGAAEAGLTALLADYQRSAGNTVTIDYGTGPELAKRVAGGQVADVLVAPAAVVDQATTDGRVDGASKTVIGRVGVGVTVRRGVTAPTITSADALKQDLLSADTVVYGQGSTGVYVDKLLADMGIAELLKPKVHREITGADVARRIVAGTGNEVGLGAITELKMFTTKGATYVGPLPAAIQNYTTYVAARMMRGTSPDLARGFLAYLATPAARQAFAASGVE